MEERDCVHPDCLVRTTFGCACEHSCPFEEDKSTSVCMELEVPRQEAEPPQLNMSSAYTAETSLRPANPEGKPV